MTRERGMQFPYLDITTVQSAGVSPFFGGVQAYWTAEAQTRTETEPQFKMMELKANELSGYSVSSNILLQDAAFGIEKFLMVLRPGRRVVRGAAGMRQGRPSVRTVERAAKPRSGPGIEFPTRLGTIRFGARAERHCQEQSMPQPQSLPASLSVTEFAAEDLEKHRGHWLAFTPDGSRLIASCRVLNELDAKVRAAGENPEEVLLDWIPGGDVILGGAELS